MAIFLQFGAGRLIFIFLREQCKAVRVQTEALDMLLEDMTEVSDTGVAAYRSRDPTMVWRVIRRCTETEKPPTVEVPDAEMLPTVDMDGFKKAKTNHYMQSCNRHERIPT